MQGRRILAVMLVVGGVLMGAGQASARDAQELTADDLRIEMSQNRALAAYVARNGLPDLAESRFLATRPPWDDHEVALYYLDARTEVGFARAWILGRPEIHLERYERPLSDAQVAALSTRPKLLSNAGPSKVSPGEAGPSEMSPAERAEAAARRAEAAADRLEPAVAAAEQHAERAEAVATKMESGFHRALRK